MRKYLSDFKARQMILTVFVVCTVIFLVFYWTFLFFDKKQEDVASDIAMIVEKIEKVQGLTNQIETKSGQKRLNQSLLTFVQSLNRGKLTNMKLVSTLNKQEQVSFRAEHMVYSEFLQIVMQIEQYDNVWVKSVVLSKRFDNPKLIDIVFDVVRGQ